MKRFLLLIITLSTFAFTLNTTTASSPKHDQLIDLTYEFSDETIYWPTSQPFELQTVTEGVTDHHFFYAAKHFSSDEHGGTHMDAPFHFAQEGQTIEQIPLHRLVGNGVVIDVSDNAAKTHDYLVSVADLTSWEKQHGALAANSIVLIRTGYGLYWPDSKTYLGTSEKGIGALTDLHFPGLSQEAAQWLVDHKIKAVGIDTASIDYGQSTTYPAHQVLAKANVPVFENVAKLNELPANDFMITALPMKIAGGTGAPLRIIAHIK